MKATNTILALLFVIIISAGHGYAEDKLLPQPVTGEKKRHYESLGRAWVERVWKTNDCYIVVYPFERPKAKWTYHPGFWTNEFSKCLVSARQKPISQMLPWKRVELEFNVDITNRYVRIGFEFFDDGSDNVLMAQCKPYTYPNVPYHPQDYKPIHTNEQLARQKAAEYAALFGVPNLWDKTKFELRSFGFFYGVWNSLSHPSSTGIRHSIQSASMLPICRDILLGNGSVACTRSRRTFRRRPR